MQDKKEFSELTDPRQLAYVAEYGESGSHGKAAEAAGISTRQGYNWRHATTPEHRVFQESLRVARQQLCDRVEAEIIRRALEDHSDKMLIFLAKRLMPEYREGYRKPSAKEEAHEAAEREMFDQLKQQKVDGLQDSINWHSFLSSQKLLTTPD